MHSTQAAVLIFSNISTAFGTLAIHFLSTIIASNTIPYTSNRSHIQHGGHRHVDIESGVGTIAAKSLQTAVLICVQNFDL